VYQHYGIITLDLFTNIHYFAFGGIPAYIFVFRKDIIKKLGLIPAVYKYLYALSVLAIIVLMANTRIISDPKITSFLLSVLFSGLI
ncbi:hypothetical protein ABTD21_19775, partial [Acinetobacter baumannii]